MKEQPFEPKTININKTEKSEKLNDEKAFEFIGIFKIKGKDLIPIFYYFFIKVYWSYSRQVAELLQE